MALFKKNIELVNNFQEVTVLDATIKIDSIAGNKNKIDFRVLFLKQDTLLETKLYTFLPTLGGDNFIKQAYEYLKTLEEFKEAEDC